MNLEMYLNDYEKGNSNNNNNNHLLETNKQNSLNLNNSSHCQLQLQQEEVANMYQQQNGDVYQNVYMSLEDRELWSKFYSLTNEMILTKAGRRTFPLIKIRLNGLEDNSLYTIQVEFRVSDSFKYRFVNGEWRTSPRTEKISPLPILYEHPDSPNFGHHWSKDSIAFAKLKLTNNENTKSADSVFLRSLNKYDPVIHIYKHDKKNVDDKMLVFSHCFKETQFIAVTAYQNEQITGLKIKYNPFAKAFLNNNSKPLITIENNTVVTTPAPSSSSSNSNNNSIVLKQESKQQQQQQPTATTTYTQHTNYQIQNQTQQVQCQSHSNANSTREENSSTSNLLPTVPAATNYTTNYQNNLIMPTNPHKIENYSQQDFIQNWYATRYPIALPTAHYHHQTPTLNYNKAYGSTTESQNNVPYGAEYATQYFNNQYLQHYQQRFQSQANFQHQDMNLPQYTTGYSSPNNYAQHHQLTYPAVQTDFSNVFDYDQSNRPFQSNYSPINDFYNKSINTTNHKRSNHSMLKESRQAPYSVNRPQRRPNSNGSNELLPILDNMSLPISPVYGNINQNNLSIAKLDFNDQSDDSLNSTENYLGNQINQSVQSSVSSVSSASSSCASNNLNLNNLQSNVYSNPNSNKNMILNGSSSNNNKNTNESGYYSHSPTSIAIMLDNANPNQSTESTNE